MPGQIVHNDPKEWLRRPQSALRVAKLAGAPGTNWEDFCFLCQQAAEKAIKAVYVAHRLSFNFTHDLDSLLRGLVKKGFDVPENVYECIFLTRYASEMRYPGFYERVTRSDHARAVDAARDVLSWAKEEVKR